MILLFYSAHYLRRKCSNFDKVETLLNAFDEGSNTVKPKVHKHNVKEELSTKILEQACKYFQKYTSTLH